LLGGPTEGMRAECRSLGGRRSPGEKCADEAGEQITAAAGGEAGIAARHNLLGAAQIGDDCRHTLQQHVHLSFVAARAAADQRSFAASSATRRPRARGIPQVRRANERTTVRRHVGTKYVQRIGVDYGRH